MAEINSIKHGPLFQDITGKRRGRWVVVKYAGKDNSGHTLWSCRCDCGTVRVVRGGHLGRGSRSCGCLNREMLSKRATVHGQVATPEHNTWRGIIQRCTNPNSKYYHYYGGRGITICNRWMTSFKNFLSDMGLKPSPKHSIERINNSLGYCPENCTWATPTEQNRNSRRNRLVTFRCETHCLAVWAEKTGINYYTLYNRLRRGWPLEKALMTPVQARKRKT